MLEKPGSSLRHVITVSPTIRPDNPTSSRPPPQAAPATTRVELARWWAKGHDDHVPDPIDHTSEATRTRYRGTLLGLATGDALGTTLEFRPPGTFTPIDDMIGGGPFHLSPGEWTDDTSMALCLAESLIECRGFDAIDQLERYVRWRDDGHLSSNGRCFDVGTTVDAALARFERTREPWCGSEAPHTAGNGSLMRLAPVVLAHAHDPTLAVRRAADSSRTTHAAREAVDACRWFAILLLRALDPHATKEVILAPDFSAAERRALAAVPLAPRIAEITAGSFAVKHPPDVTGEGYVVRSIEAALWAFHRSDSFRDGALLAVNLGDDADTTGAIYGQIAGAFHGERGIPAEWRAKLALREEIESFADSLLELRAALAER